MPARFAVPLSLFVDQFEAIRSELRESLRLIRTAIDTTEAELGIDGGRSSSERDRPAEQIKGSGATPNEATSAE